LSCPQPYPGNLAGEQEGRWKLVKINTEEYPELAQQFKIMSIPNVKLISKGEAIGEFVGALPKSAIEKWLDEHIPSQEDEDLKDLISPEANWPDAEMASKIQNFSVEHPNNKEARLALAKYTLIDDPDKAVGLVADFMMGDDGYDSASDIRTVVEFLQFRPDNDNGVAPLLVQAQSDIKSMEFEAAIEQIIQSVTVDKAYRNELPRRIAIALFRIMGPSHPVTKKYRKLFDMALY
jgi:putative thioredoxin